MRKVKAGLFVSLDGVVESPDRWNSDYFDEEVGETVGAAMASSDAMLLGRVTYQEFSAYWPRVSSEDNPFAGRMNNAPKYVVSTTLKGPLEWQNSTLIDGSVAEAVEKLKRQPGSDISITGSGTLVHFLLREGLLDELGLFVFPVVVGGGKRLFENGGDKKALELVDAKTFGTGVVSLTYRQAGK